MTDKLREAIAEQISEGLGAILRKFCDSPEAKQARHYPHAMPKSDWDTLIGMLAEESAGAARAALAAAPQPASERSELDALRKVNSELIRENARLIAAPQPVPVDDYHNDPSTDDRWNAGCDYAMTALCKLLRINTDDVTWDAATGELEGDVLSVLSNILTVRFGDDWRKDAPQPAPDREELVRLLRIITRNGSLDDGRTLHEIIADALLARGLRLPD